jgi:hypothetical protein
MSKSLTNIKLRSLTADLSKTEQSPFLIQDENTGILLSGRSERKIAVCFS